MADMTFVEKLKTSWSGTRFSEDDFFKYWCGVIPEKDLRAPIIYNWVSKDHNGAYWLKIPVSDRKLLLRDGWWVLVGNETGEVRVMSDKVLQELYEEMA